MSQKRGKISRIKLHWFTQTRLWKEIQTWGEVAKQQSVWCHVFNYKEKSEFCTKMLSTRLRRNLKLIDKNVREKSWLLNKHLHGHCSPLLVRFARNLPTLPTKYLLCFTLYKVPPMFYFLLLFFSTIIQCRLCLRGIPIYSSSSVPNSDSPSL